MAMWFIVESLRRWSRANGPYPADAETAASCRVEPLGRGKGPALRISPCIFLPFQAPFRSHL
jgi:hypothetical protein